MPIQLGDLCKLVAGELAGDHALPIHGADILVRAKPGEITFIDDPTKLRELQATSASAAVVPRGVLADHLPTVQVDDVHAAFAAIVTRFRPPRRKSHGGVSPHAIVSPTAQLAEGVEVHAGAIIGDDVQLGKGTVVHAGARIMAGCQIGENVTIFPNAVLYEDSRIGPRCILHAGVSIGAYGFGYRQVAGRHALSAQLGYVEIGADVEIGAGSTIDRGTYGPTTVGEGTKIDNLVMIGHNCQIGRHNLLCSQVGIAGSSTTGDYVVMAGQVGVSDHVKVGDRAILCAQTGISNDVANEAVMFGYPGLPLSQQRRCIAVFGKLPEMRQQMRDLQKSIDAMQQRSLGERNAAA
ncbi:MAG: UDP-3-O-(3-hydroxymyristoyl)glucosamine N-acyltransferase [Pirellulales bacterium]